MHAAERQPQCTAVALSVAAAEAPATFRRKGTRRLMARIQAGAMSSSTRPANCRLNLRLLGTKAANYTSIGRRK